MPNIGYVEPPRQQRRRKSGLEDAAVASMVELLGNSAERWVTDHETYRDQKKAIARAQAYRRAVSIEMNLAPSNIKTRVWEADGGWVFALKKELS
jgi:hypothetical protein